MMCAIGESLLESHLSSKCISQRIDQQQEDYENCFYWNGFSHQ